MTRKPLASLPARLFLAVVCAVSVLATAGLSARLQPTPAQCRPKTHAVYETKAMNSAEVGENVRVVDHGLLIHYMSQEERERSRVVIVNGTLYTSMGQPTPYGADNESLNYVMDAAGNFYVFNQTGHPELRHSSFFDGGPVACGGDLDVKKGKIVKINADSGHYSPSATMFNNVLVELKKDGVDLTTLALHPGGLTRRR